jgi:hypothetical protein
MPVHENTRRRAAHAVAELTESLALVGPACDRLALRFVGLSFVLACLPCDQRALPAATAGDEKLDDCPECDARGGEDCEGLGQTLDGGEQP